ncbi:glycerate kinase [Cryptosporangium aurantiacum]|uniref:Glycerate kinase n=1 Tax=Cryptosporangium aurantiacum TaxID=134849 RepID=A0A1M7R7N5_9ACTN|nr:glycerate kinase [Cryptosporangium aurantiacum]SHN42314.1 glycerate kinase [Cryptosporangium aurantiacum]
MRVLVAPDSFGGTLSAGEAAAAIAAGWKQTAPDDTVVTRPLSDGGPGLVEVIRATLGGSLVPVRACGPRMEPLDASFLLVDDVAYLECATVAGLQLVPKAERDPKVTTTYGLGLLLAAAVESGARRVVIGLGGSVTNDGGAGLLAALGAGPVGVSGTALPPGGGALRACEGLAGLPALRGVEIVAATDVDNPLTGIHGASAVYGPQKGATDNDVQILDAALSRWADVLVRDLPGCPPDVAALPGAGAAGGLGVALLALGGRREAGIGLVRRLIGFDTAVADADLVITGEGSFDYQSLRGKVVAGVASAAAEHGAPCVVLAGQVAVGRQEAAAAHVDEARSLVEHAGSVERAMADAGEVLTSLAARTARDWSRARPIR